MGYQRDQPDLIILKKLNNSTYQPEGALETARFFMSGSASLILAGNNSTVDPYLPVVWADFTTPDIQGPDWIDNSGTTGNRMVTDSTGTLTWAPHNLLLNSATLSTQTVTVTVGATNILSFYGTGSITLSGGATGTLTGTGASNRVSLVITPTTASLTLTVSGSVTQAQLERVTYQTQPRQWIETGATQVFLPRYDHNGATTPATPIGMLIEEQRQNLLVNTEQFDAAGWAKGNLVTTGMANVVSAPDGKISADKIVENTTASVNHFAGQSVSVTSGMAYTVSCFARSNGRNIVVEFASGGFGVNKQATFNLSNGTSSELAGVTASISNVGNGWYRFVATCTATATASTALYFILDNSGSQIYTGDGSSGVYLWGAQLEAGSFATSYIPNLASSGVATRLADVPVVNATAFAASFSSIRGTYAVQFRTNWTGTATGSAIILEFDNANNRIVSILPSSNTAVSQVSGGSNLVATGSVVGSTSRVALSYDAAGRSITSNGGTVATSAVAFPTNMTVNRIGQNFGSANMNGYLQSFAYYSTRLPDATLKQKSTVGAAY